MIKHVNNQLRPKEKIFCDWDFKNCLPSKKLVELICEDIMIKAILFDFGGVVLDMKPLLSKTQEVISWADKNKLWEIINLEAISLCKGRINILQFWRNVAKRLGKNIPIKTLNDLWIKDYENLTSVDKKVEELVNSLKKNYKLAIISNTIGEHANINKRLGRFRSFDIVILSNEVGLTKDEKAIFFLATEQLGVKPKECVFIDDTERFLKVPSNLGMKTIHFKDPRQLQEDLEDLGLILSN